MKNKAEVIKAVETCLFADTSCNDCPYCDMTDCVNRVISDLRAILNKSDFEVVKEILEKSEEYHNDYSYEIQGNDYPTIILHRGTQMLWVDFDGEGNIL